MLIDGVARNFAVAVDDGFQDPCGHMIPQRAVLALFLHVDKGCEFFLRRIVQRCKQVHASDHLSRASRKMPKASAMPLLYAAITPVSAPYAS